LEGWQYVDASVACNRNQEKVLSFLKTEIMLKYNLLKEPVKVKAYNSGDRKKFPEIYLYIHT
jgi:hypothetical protein